ncbi:hypothetical protein N9A04_00285 [Rickettsiales bacterium]|nr:hypothetical protein [Rickettsiales bacterium]
MPIRINSIMPMNPKSTKNKKDNTNHKVLHNKLRGLQISKRIDIKLIAILRRLYNKMYRSFDQLEILEKMLVIFSIGFIIFITMEWITGRSIEKYFQKTAPIMTPILLGLSPAMASYSNDRRQRKQKEEDRKQKQKEGKEDLKKLENSIYAMINIGYQKHYRTRENIKIALRDKSTKKFSNLFKYKDNTIYDKISRDIFNNIHRMNDAKTDKIIKFEESNMDYIDAIDTWEKKNLNGHIAQNNNKIQTLNEAYANGDIGNATKTETEILEKQDKILTEFLISTEGVFNKLRNEFEAYKHIIKK